jgi:hypothetical protein
MLGLITPSDGEEEEDEEEILWIDKVPTNNYELKHFEP